MADLSPIDPSAPKHLELYLEWLDKIEKGQTEITITSMAERAGITVSSMSDGFKVCRKYLNKLDRTKRESIIERINSNLLHQALMGSKTREQIIKKANENALRGDLDLDLQKLSNSMLSDTLDRLPETSKKNAEIQITNINASQTVIPNLLDDRPEEVRKGLGDMMGGEE